MKAAWVVLCPLRPRSWSLARAGSLVYIKLTLNGDESVNASIIGGPGEKEVNRNGY